LVFDRGEIFIWIDLHIEYVGVLADVVSILQVKVRHGVFSHVGSSSRIRNYAFRTGFRIVFVGQYVDPLLWRIGEF